MQKVSQKHRVTEFQAEKKIIHWRILYVMEIYWRISVRGGLLGEEEEEEEEEEKEEEVGCERKTEPSPRGEEKYNYTLEDD